MSAVDPIQNSVAAFAQDNSVTAPVDVAALTEAIQTLNTHNAAGDNNQIVATIDERTHRITVQIVDRDTGRIVRQVAPPSIFMMFKKLTADGS